MKFAIEVGEAVRERVEFRFDQLTGRTVILCNGCEVKRQVRWFSEPVLDIHEFDLGEREKVRVRIEKRRRYLFASRYLVYLNNRLARCFQGV